MADDRYIIAGLGNPGKEYAGTRHNLGFAVVDRLAERLGVNVSSSKFGAKTAQASYEDKKLILVKPWQYMNNSGQSVASIAGYYQVSADRILVIADDIALSASRLRIRKSGTSGGQKGLADVLAKLGTNSVPRLRIGIGSDRRIEAVDYVLGRPRPDEVPLLEKAVELAAEAALYWLSQGIEKAMSKYNAEAGSEETEQTGKV